MVSRVAGVTTATSSTGRVFFGRPLLVVDHYGDEAQRDRPAVRGQISHAGGRLVADHHRGRALDDGVGRADTGRLVADTGGRLAADQDRGAAWGNDWPTHVEHRARRHGAGVKVADTSRGGHGWFSLFRVGSRNLSTSYYGRCWPHLAPGADFFLAALAESARLLALGLRLAAPSRQRRGAAGQQDSLPQKLVIPLWRPHRFRGQPGQHSGVADRLGRQEWGRRNGRLVGRSEAAAAEKRRQGGTT